MKNKGFTLIEMIVVIVLISIIAVVSSKMLASGLNAYLTEKYIIDAGSQARLALERMVRDIRAIRSPSDLTTATATQLVFVDVNGVTNTYTLSGATLTRNGQVLAEGISSLTFSYFDNNGASTAVLANINYVTILLNINLQNVVFSIRTSVYPRNLL